MLGHKHGNYSLVALSKTQIAFVRQWVQGMRTGEIASVMPTAKATADRASIADATTAAPRTTKVGDIRS